MQILKLTAEEKKENDISRNCFTSNQFQKKNNENGY